LITQKLKNNTNCFKGASRKLLSSSKSRRLAIEVGALIVYG